MPKVKLIILFVFIAFSGIEAYSQKDSMPYITGICYMDTNRNGLLDAGEPPLQGIFVASDHCPVPEVTCIYGNYYHYLCDTVDSMRVHKPDWALYYTVTPEWHYVWQDSSYVNFGFVQDTSAQDLKITGINTSPPPRSGYDSYIYTGYQNLGKTVTGSVLTVTIDNSLTYISATPSPSLVQGNTITWELPVLNHLDYSVVSIKYGVPSSAAAGTPLVFTSTIEPQAGDWNIADNSVSKEIITVDVINDYYKTCEQDIVIDIDEVPFSPEIEYSIHFRNNGQGEIVNIRIADTLSEMLMHNTAHLITSSHPCTFIIDENGLLTVIFSDIFLPDSASAGNECYGYFTYSIRTRNDLQVHDVIENKAYLYYDFNEALITNTVINIVDETTGIHEKATSGIVIYPNPATNNITLNAAAGVYYCIINFTGKILLNGCLSYNIQEINISHLSPGCYFLMLNDGNRILRTSFIKE